MKKANILIVLLVCLAVLSLSVPAFARFDREEADEAGYVDTFSTNTDRTLTSVPVYVYGVTVYASAASNTTVALYDSTSKPADGNVARQDAKIEVGEATQYDADRFKFDPPIEFKNGIYADVTSCYVLVEYR